MGQDKRSPVLGPDEEAGTYHWMAHGRAEGRAPGGFDAARYLANYADLRAAYGPDQEAATAHYIVHGASEGRTEDPWA